MAKKETTKKSATKKKVTAKEKEVKVEELEQVFEEAAPIEEPTEEPAPIEEPDTQEPLEVMNGDPSVVTPVEEEDSSVGDDEDGPYNLDPVSGELVPAEPLREKQEEKPTVSNDEFRKVFEAKVNSQRTKIKLDRSFGLTWNGQEIDY